MQERQAAAAAAKGTAPPKAALEGDDGEDLDPNLYYERRVKAIKAAKDAGEHTYPHKFHVSINLTEFVQKYESIPEGEHLEDAPVSLAGRIYNKRTSGTKLVFYDLQSDGVRIQVMADARYILRLLSYGIYAERRRSRQPQCMFTCTVPRRCMQVTAQLFDSLYCNFAELLVSFSLAQHSPVMTQ